MDLHSDSSAPPIATETQLVLDPAPLETSGDQEYSAFGLEELFSQLTPDDITQQILRSAGMISSFFRNFSQIPPPDAQETPENSSISRFLSSLTLDGLDQRIKSSAERFFNRLFDTPQPRPRASTRIRRYQTQYAGFKYSENGEEDCTICIEPLKRGENTVSLPCLHIYHYHCISTWLRRHSSCPICRIRT